MADAERADELAFTYCLRRLTAAARSEHDLRTKLRERGYEDGVIDAVLGRLRRAGYVDDAEYAQMWVRSRSRSKALTAPVLRQELRRKGIDETLIDEAVAQTDPESEDDRARELLVRKLPSQVPPPGPERDRLKRRLGGILARKGYGGSRVWGLVDEVIDQSASHELPRSYDAHSLRSRTI